ncbi:MAG: hypothetical protein D6714_14785 [Bacteroidetes bacterium]|nr:MAG: hypothetical protein D6714_14785 [Bacteroidota bacterium]
MPKVLRRFISFLKVIHHTENKLRRPGCSIENSRRAEPCFEKRRKGTELTLFFVLLWITSKQTENPPDFFTIPPGNF